MAGEKKNNDVVFKGSKQTVTVEDSCEGVVIVRLDYSGSIYRGALLNVTNREVPCGVNILRLQSNVWMQKSTSVDDEKQCDGPENSSTGSRFSYQMEPLAPLPERTVPTKSSNRGYKEKTVRNIRLRPRQVLCAKCKTSCTDQPSKKTGLTKLEEKSADKVALPPPTIPLKISLRKSTSSDSSDKTERQNKPVIQKTSPIIKISFNNPQGQGTVVNIPRKVQQSEHSDSENDESKNSAKSSSGIATRRVKKSIKKAKDRLHPYSPHTKHGKHKKHKHKHEKKLSQEMNPVVALSPLNLESLNNENCDISVSRDSADPDSPYRSPLRTKVIMKRERSASGSMNYVYQAQRVGSTGSTPSVEEDSKKNLTISLRRIDGVTGQDENSVTCDTVDKNISEEENIGPLMMRIQTKSVSKVMLEDQRTISSGDIVWGKIHGFPWWPGRVESIKIGQKTDGSIIYQQAHVSWFGSSTRSDIACSELYNFLEDFESKFNKKKRGPYRVAIKEATRQAKGMTSIAEDCESQESETIDDQQIGDLDFDVDIEAITSGTNTPRARSECNSPTMTQADAPSFEALSQDVLARSPPVLSPHGGTFVPMRTPPLPSPKYSPISNASPKFSPAAENGSSPLSTPKYSPVPYSPKPTSPGYSPGHVTSPIYTSTLTSLPKYAPAPSTSPLYQATTPKYPPVPMTSFHYSPAPMTSSPYNTSQTTSPYYAQPVVTSPYYGGQAVTSPYYAAVPMTSKSPRNSPVTGSSPKPLARYSPKYSPVTPTPSPLQSPVIASPVQCV